MKLIGAAQVLEQHAYHRGRKRHCLCAFVLEDCLHDGKRAGHEDDGKHVAKVANIGRDLLGREHDAAGRDAGTEGSTAKDKRHLARCCVLEVDSGIDGSKQGARHVGKHDCVVLDEVAIPGPDDAICKEGDERKHAQLPSALVLDDAANGRRSGGMYELG